jgi:hypothetical protein
VVLGAGPAAVSGGYGPLLPTSSRVGCLQYTREVGGGAQPLKVRGWVVALSHNVCSFLDLLAAL